MNINRSSDARLVPISVAIANAVAVCTPSVAQHLCSCGNGRRRAASQGQVTGEGLHRGVYFNRTETVPDRQPGRRSKQVPRPRQDWIAIAVPAIIDERTF